MPQFYPHLVTPVFHSARRAATLITPVFPTFHPDRGAAALVTPVFPTGIAEPPTLDDFQARS